MRLLENHIAIYLRKKERSEQVKESAYFEFQWEVSFLSDDSFTNSGSIYMYFFQASFLYDKYLSNILDSSWRIVEFSFHENTQHDIQEEVSKVPIISSYNSKGI